MPFTELRHKAIRLGVRIGSQLLKGVGVGRDVVFTTDPPEVAIHVQKPLTKEEIEFLPDGWMNIPAIDERGPCKLLEVK